MNCKRCKKKLTSNAAASWGGGNTTGRLNHYLWEFMNLAIDPACLIFCKDSIHLSFSVVNNVVQVLFKVVNIFKLACKKKSHFGSFYMTVNFTFYGSSGRNMMFLQEVPQAALGILQQLLCWFSCFMIICICKNTACEKHRGL